MMALSAISLPSFPYAHTLRTAPNVRDTSRNRRTIAAQSAPTGTGAVGVATAKLSKSAGDGKNSTCSYYGNFNANPYFGKGLTAALPDALFGKRCGACFKGSEAAPVNITYKRTNCQSTAGSAVRVRSNSTAEHFNIQMVGLAGPGTLIEVELSADGKKWVKLTRDENRAIWGIKGAEAKEVVGAKKAMSVRLTAGHTHEKITLENVIPAAWKAQTLYSFKTNFKKLLPESK
ncbi:unnamed protein product [Closterium sp. Yama58-4]|nr:unnamed protein product [Closterium sp. Yama58-4]